MARTARRVATVINDFTGYPPELGDAVEPARPTNNMALVLGLKVKRLTLKSA
jgi:hypothetical protein